MKKYAVMMGVAFALAVVGVAQAQDKDLPSSYVTDQIDVDSLCDGVGSLAANCGFEAGNYPPTGWTVFGDTSFTGVQGTPIAHTGNWGLFSGPVNGPGGVRQMVPTTAGQTYALTFYLRNNQTPNSFRVTWNNQEVYSCVNCPNFDYTVFGFSGLVGAAGSTELSFAFYNVPDFFWFDDVIVVQCNQ